MRQLGWHAFRWVMTLSEQLSLSKLQHMDVLPSTVLFPITLLHECTHTHTQSCICGLRGLIIAVMVFILYKLYVLLPYTYPTPKLSPHRRLCAFLDFQKKHHLVCFFKPFGLRGHKQCPHKPPSWCNTHVIIHICVLNLCIDSVGYV